MQGEDTANVHVTSLGMEESVNIDYDLSTIPDNSFERLEGPDGVPFYKAVLRLEITITTEIRVRVTRAGTTCGSVTTLLE